MKEAPNAAVKLQFVHPQSNLAARDYIKFRDSD
jgi:hypothetical protein